MTLANKSQCQNVCDMLVYMCAMFGQGSPTQSEIKQGGHHAPIVLRSPKYPSIIGLRILFFAGLIFAWIYFRGFVLNREIKSTRNFWKMTNCEN